MNKILKKYIPEVSVAFLIVVLFSSILGLINGEDYEGFRLYVLQMFIYLTVAVLIDTLIRKFDFKTYIGHFLMETIVLYPITLAAAYIGKWFGFYLKNVIVNSIIYLVIMALIHYYFYIISKSEAEDMNQLLRESKK